MRINASDRKVQDRRNLPIGVFDSGVGGISVLKEMVALLPEEDFVFFGDSANAPYGTKSIRQVQRLTLSGVERLCAWKGKDGKEDPDGGKLAGGQKGVKAVVIACNTATSAAIALLREKYTQMPVIGIEPAIKPALHMKEHPRVVVLATPATVKGEKFRLLMKSLGGEGEVVPIGCPGLMEFVEQGILEGEQVDALLRELLAPVLNADAPADAIVLGCTHYPFLKEAIAKVVGKDTAILDGSIGTARQLRRRLAEEGLLREAPNEKSPQNRVVFEMSLPGKEELCRRLLG